MQEVGGVGLYSTYDVITTEKISILIMTGMGTTQ